MNARMLAVLLFCYVCPTTRAGRNDLLIPPSLPVTAPRLSTVLLDDQGLPIRSSADWLRQRVRLREQWLNFLGAFPEAKAPLRTTVLATEELAQCTRQWVRYQIEEGIFTDGYLLAPKPAQGLLPAVVVFHPTTPLHAQGVAGLSADYPEEKWQGLQLVERGYLVWCPRNYIYAEGADMPGNVLRLQSRHPNWTGMARMVWDAVRAVDFLESLPNVDRKHIGCLGHSLGGKEVLYAMAFDERYQAGVSSEGGIGLKFSNWEAPWYLGPKIRQPDFALENHQLLALIAPRAFLLLAGEAADGNKSWPFIAAARPVYELFGATGNLGWKNHHFGHRYPPEARIVAEGFLDTHLKR